MSAFSSDRWRQTIYNAFHRLAGAWKVLVYGFNGSGYTPMSVDSDGHVQVDVLSGGSPPVTTLVTLVGSVAGTDIASDTVWDTVISNSGNMAARRIILQNTTDAPLEVSFEDSPSTTADADVWTHIGPRTVLDLGLKGDGEEVIGDISVPRFSTTPVGGTFFATIFGV